VEKYSIALAKEKDLPIINKIYETARSFMKANGNKTQWKDNYPESDLIKEDIESKRLFVISGEDSVIHAVFVFMIGKDKSYEKITGSWLLDTEYGVIHRVASDGKIPKIMDKVVAFCEKQIPHLRIDTHEDNKTMQKAVEKLGFKRLGIIQLDDRSFRILYELKEEI